MNTTEIPKTVTAKTQCPDCLVESDIRQETPTEWDVKYKMKGVDWETYFTGRTRCEKCEAIHAKKSDYAANLATMKRSGFPERHSEQVEGYKGDSVAKARDIQPIIESGGVVVLYGDRGRGKTGIATWLAWQRIQDGKPPGEFWRAMQIFLRIRAAFRKDSKESEEDIVESFQKSPFLVVDELHERSESDWENRVLTEIMNGRYESRKPTLIITNSDKDSLGASLGPSLVDRIRETGVFVRCNWESYRRPTL